MAFSKWFSPLVLASVTGLGLATLGLLGTPAFADEVDDTYAEVPPVDQSTLNAATSTSLPVIFNGGEGGNPTQVPEPSSLLGILLVGGFCWRQRQARQAS